jgi:protein TonB
MKFLFASLFCLIVMVAVKAQNSADSTIYSKVENEASYCGGDKAWIKFLGKTLHYPDDAINNMVQGKVMVQFVVNIDSSIIEIQAVSGPTKGGLREESVRVVTASGKWVPATLNGKPVRSYKKTPIQFKIN